MPIITTHADDQLVDHAIPADRQRTRPTTTLRSVALLPWATFGHIATGPTRPASSTSSSVAPGASRPCIVART